MVDNTSAMTYLCIDMNTPFSEYEDLANFPKCLAYRNFVVTSSNFVAASRVRLWGELPQSYPSSRKSSGLSTTTRKRIRMSAISIVLVTYYRRYCFVIWNVDQIRTDFAQSVIDLPCQSLREICLEVNSYSPHNERFKPQSVLLPSLPSTDHLSLALQRFSQLPLLTTLKLRGGIVMSPCFFWPEGSPSIDVSFWPRLQYLEVWLNSTTPSGEWYHIGDPNDRDEGRLVDRDPLTMSDLEPGDSVHSSDSDNPEVPDTYSPRLEEHLRGEWPWHSFRKVLDPERIDPMLMAMARATALMP
jgi:hypothetical protein